MGVGSLEGKERNVVLSVGRKKTWRGGNEIGKTNDVHDQIALEKTGCWEKEDLTGWARGRKK